MGNSNFGIRVQLQQVVLNLVVNAFEAMEASEDRELVLRTRQAHGKITLDVMDSGPGIPPDKLGSIFEPFFTTKTTGLGLGLSLSRSIVMAHSGRLWADNNVNGLTHENPISPKPNFVLPIRRSNHSSTSKQTFSR